MDEIRYTVIEQTQKGIPSMNSISQLLDQIKHLSSLFFAFSSQLEPLILVNNIPDPIYSKINSLDFINLLNDCYSAFNRISDCIN